MVFPTAIVQAPVSEWVIKPQIELRERYERRVDRDFLGSNSDNRDDLWGRYRVGISAEGPRGQRAEAIYQYGHRASWTPRRNFSAERSDLLLGNYQFRAGQGRVTVGRQFVDKNLRRLFGRRNFSNVTTTLDIVRYQDDRWDVFAGKVGLDTSPLRDARIAHVGLNHSGGQTNLIYKSDKAGGRSQGIYTLNHYLRRDSGRLRAELDASYQTGSLGGRRHEAHYLVQRNTYHLGQKTTAIAEFAVASGGDPNGRVSRTFDSLYPAAHAPHGLMDLVGSNNMRGISLNLRREVAPAVELSAELHRWWLDNPREAWLGNRNIANRGAGGVFIDPTGAAGRDLGVEATLFAIWNPNRQNTIQAGFGVFSPGRFVRTVNGGSAGKQTWGYLQWTWRF